METQSFRVNLEGENLFTTDTKEPNTSVCNVEVLILGSTEPNSYFFVMSSFPVIVDAFNNIGKEMNAQCNNCIILTTVLLK